MSLVSGSTMRYSVVCRPVVSGCIQSNRSAQVAVWAIALLVPLFVAFSRLYRGMHHPLDVAGGALVGIAALSALVLVCRAANLAATQATR